MDSAGRTWWLPGRSWITTKHRGVTPKWRIESVDDVGIMLCESTKPHPKQARNGDTHKIVKPTSAGKSPTLAAPCSSIAARNFSNRCPSARTASADSYRTSANRCTSSAEQSAKRFQTPSTVTPARNFSAQPSATRFARVFAATLRPSFSARAITCDTFLFTDCLRRRKCSARISGTIASRYHSRIMSSGVRSSTMTAMSRGSTRPVSSTTSRMMVCRVVVFMLLPFCLLIPAEPRETFGAWIARFSNGGCRKLVDTEPRGAYGTQTCARKVVVVSSAPSRTRTEKPIRAAHFECAAFAMISPMGQTESYLTQGL